MCSTCCPLLCTGITVPRSSRCQGSGIRVLPSGYPQGQQGSTLSSPLWPCFSWNGLGAESLSLAVCLVRSFTRVVHLVRQLTLFSLLTFFSLAFDFLSYLNSWVRAIISLLMLSAKQRNYWYHFYNFFGMTRSLTGDWTWDLPHSKPALYH